MWVLIVTAGCGRASAAGNLASAPRTSSPAASADPTGFAPNNCTAAPSGLPTSSRLHDNFGVVVQVPDGWSPHYPVMASETELHVFDAPPAYSSQPTTMSVLALFGYSPNEAPAQVIRHYYGKSTHATVPDTNLVGQVTDCTIGSDQGAFFRYTRGSRVGYFVVFLHFHYSYGLRLEGEGGLDARATRDAKAVLGSWRWTITTPPSR
jgi:hypothetical protein